jgi:hypothetical protein
VVYPSPPIQESPSCLIFVVLLYSPVPFAFLNGLVWGGWAHSQFDKGLHAGSAQPAKLNLKAFSGTLLTCYRWLTHRHFVAANFAYPSMSHIAINPPGITCLSTSDLEDTFTHLGRNGELGTAAWESSISGKCYSSASKWQWRQQ